MKIILALASVKDSTAYRQTMKKRPIHHHLIFSLAGGGLILAVFAN